MKKPTKAKLTEKNIGTRIKVEVDTKTNAKEAKKSKDVEKRKKIIMNYNEPEDKTIRGIKNVAEK